MSEGQSMQAEGVWTLQPLVELSAQDFRDWCRVLEERTGLVINEQRRSFLQANLGMRMRELGMTDYASYLRQVLDGPRGAVEWSLLMDRLTIQETRFFRHPPSFALLQRYLQERVQAGLQRPLALWSLGCSTGEEAYSLAVVSAEVLRDTQTADAFGVTATDISLNALNKARSAEYPARRLEQLEPQWLERYFQALPDGRYKVLPQLVARVCCARLNVLELAKAPMTGMDVIFCQNLLIYFRRWRRREILNRLAERLVPGGLLVIGVGEMSDWQHPDLQPVADEQVLAFTRKG